MSAGTVAAAVVATLGVGGALVYAVYEGWLPNPLGPSTAQRAAQAQAFAARRAAAARQAATVHGPSASQLSAAELGY